MRVFLVLLCILALSHAAQFSSRASMYKFRPSNLGFSNCSTEGVTPEQVTTTVNFINAASGFYKNNVEQNIGYIKRNLDEKYEGRAKFTVLIHTEANVTNNFYVAASEDFILGLQNVNIINPAWSYLIVKQYVRPEF